MILFKETVTIADSLSKFKRAGKTIGFVPTMGALHQGHISLINRSKTECDITICSIFINPTQFNDKQDFDKYPVTIGNDIALLEAAGCDILFLPAVTEIYPAGLTNSNHYELGEIEFVLEGKYRPGHFQGVCQVVHRLLEIVQPSTLFLGQKDYQQCLVIKRLLQLLQLPVTVSISTTYREPSGLAMSSRNMRLNPVELKNATTIYQMLLYIQANINIAPIGALKNNVAAYLLKSGFDKVDYVAIMDLDTLRDTTIPKKEDNMIALIAATIGQVRLIDNLVIDHKISSPVC